MFPFKITFYQNIEGEMTPEQIKKFLDIARSELDEKRPDYISSESNCIRYKNDFFRLSSSWSLMKYTDSGYLMLKLGVNNNTQITYGFTFIKTWIVIIIFSMIIFYSSNGNPFFLVFFGIGGTLTWLTSILRHWLIFFTIKKMYLNSNQ